MASVLEAFGTNGQVFTCSLAPGGTGLANGGARQSTLIDNTSNLFLDALVMFKIKTGSSGVSATGVVNIYAAGTVDNATTLTEGAGSSDASITLVSPTNLRFVGSINAVANGTTYTGGPFSIAAAFGGILPAKWLIIIENKTGAALDTTEASHAKLWQGVYNTVA